MTHSSSFIRLKEYKTLMCVNITLFFSHTSRLTRPLPVISHNQFDGIPLTLNLRKARICDRRTTSCTFVKTERGAEWEEGGSGSLVEGCFSIAACLPVSAALIPDHIDQDNGGRIVGSEGARCVWGTPDVMSFLF